MGRQAADPEPRPFPEVTLAEARGKRDDLNATLRDGGDPMAPRRAKRATLTLQQAGEAYWAGRRDLSPSYLVNAQRALERHIYPVGAWQAWDPALVSVALFFGGYSGTRLLEPVAGVVVERVVDFVRRIGGRPAN